MYKVFSYDIVVAQKAVSVMTIKEYGRHNTDVIMLLHGGGLSWWNYRDSAELLHKAIPGSSMEILPGLRHDDLSINHPQRYGRIMTEWIGR